MRHILWKEAAEIATNYRSQNKIIFIAFIDGACQSCAALLPMIKKHEDDTFEVFVVEDGYKMPFPPTAYPSSYIFIPNTPHETPIIKIGAAPERVIDIDVRAQKEALKTGRDYYAISRELESQIS